MIPENKKATPSAKTIRRKAKGSADTVAERGETAAAEAAAVPAVETAPVAPPPPVTPTEAPAEVAAPKVSEPKAAAAPAEEPKPVAAAPAEPVPTKPRLSEEYLVQSHYDKALKLFVAHVAEFPDLRVTSVNREAGVRELEDKLEAHVENVRRRGDQLPEAISARKYPEKIELRLSQGLFRRLDNLSRHEKTPLEQLLVELITASVERRLEPPPRPQPAERRPAPTPPSGNQRHSHPQQQQQHGHGGQHAQNRRQSMGRTYQHAMESRENFMEYVRNLEKGGGTWKNRK